jgi:hypothetical protein
MTNENSAYIHFFTVNLSGSQGEIRRPSAEKVDFPREQCLQTRITDLVTSNLFLKDK